MTTRTASTTTPTPCFSTTHSTGTPSTTTACFHLLQVLKIPWTGIGLQMGIRILFGFKHGFKDGPLLLMMKLIQTTESRLIQSNKVRILSGLTKQESLILFPSTPPVKPVTSLLMLSQEGPNLLFSLNSEYTFPSISGSCILTDGNLSLLNHGKRTQTQKRIVRNVSNLVSELCAITRQHIHIGNHSNLVRFQEGRIENTNGLCSLNRGNSGDLRKEHKMLPVGLQFGRKLRTNEDNPDLEVRIQLLPRSNEKRDKPTLLRIVVNCG